MFRILYVSLISGFPFKQQTIFRLKIINIASKTVTNKNLTFVVHIREGTT